MNFHVNAPRENQKLRIHKRTYESSSKSARRKRTQKCPPMVMTAMCTAHSEGKRQQPQHIHSPASPPLAVSEIVLQSTPNRARRSHRFPIGAICAHAGRSPAEQGGGCSCVVGARRRLSRAPRRRRRHRLLTCLRCCDRDVWCTRDHTQDIMLALKDAALDRNTRDERVHLSCVLYSAITIKQANSQTSRP